MKWRIDYIEKAMRPVEVHAGLFIDPGVYAVPDYVARHIVVDGADYPAKLNELIEAGHQIMNLAPVSEGAAIALE